MRNSTSRFFLAPSVALAAACLGAFAPCVRAAVLEDTVATVNGRPILLSEYQKELGAVEANWKQAAPALIADKGSLAELRRKVLDQMVDNLLLQQEAEKRKIKLHDREIDSGVAEIKERSFRRNEAGKVLSDAEVDAALEAELKKEGLPPSAFRERIRKQLMMRRVVEETVRPKVTAPEEAQLKDAYSRLSRLVAVAPVSGSTQPVAGSTQALAGLGEEEAQAYLALAGRMRELTAERVKVAHILIKAPQGASKAEKDKALAKARELRKRLEAGEDFAELARKNSEDEGSAPQGGELGFLLRGWMPPEFEKAAFSTPVGGFSEPVETLFGYHLLHVSEKKAAQKLSYDKTRDDVGQFLMNLRFQSELEKFVQSLRAQAHVEVKLPQDKEPQGKDEKDKKDAPPKG